MPAGEVLRRDVHPAEVACPDGRVIRGRAFATSHRLVVWTEPERGKVDVALDVELEEPFSVPASRGTLQGSLECATGWGTFWVNRGRGCGCGQVALKALGAPVGWTGT